MLASHGRDGAERAGPVAAFGNLQVRKVPRRDSQPSRVVQRFDWCRAKQFSLLACSANQSVGHSVNFVSAEHADDVVDFGHLFQERAADTFG